MTRAVTVEIVDGERRLAIRTVEAPRAGPGEVVVAVRAVSLNHGETAGSLRHADAGHRPGWDFAGTVEEAPPGARHVVGERVFGFLFRAGTWAERIAVPERQLAPIPAGVTFEDAATLPIAGLTVLVALTKRPPTSGMRVLVTGASGGVGTAAIQLAAATGADVTAYSRTAANRSFLESLGARSIVSSPEALATAAPFDLVIEGVGGALLGTVLGRLATRATCVLLGDAAGRETTTFDARHFRLGADGTEGGKTLYAFFLVEEFERPGGFDAPRLLGQLADAVAGGQLKTNVEQIRSWQEIDAVARGLLDGKVRGKAVLRID